MEKSLLQERIKISKKKNKHSQLFHTEILERKIVLPFKFINATLIDQLMYQINKNFEGKCLKEGYVKSGSSEIISHTFGRVDGSDVTFHVVFRCLVCYPYEDMLINCMVESVTKIGIKAIVAKDENPVVVFISREHNSNVDIDNYEEGDSVQVKVIGTRYEINDEYISILGEIINE